MSFTNHEQWIRYKTRAHNLTNQINVYLINFSQYNELQCEIHNDVNYYDDDVNYEDDGDDISNEDSSENRVIT